MDIKKITASALITSMAMSLLCSCSDENPLNEAIVGKNSFIITLYPDIAPITCENFQKLIDEGFYNGLTFHRVVDDFIVQGGDPNGDGTGASSEAIKGEFSENGISNNLSHVKGTVSMARADDFNSATCQFFICLTELTYLDGSYAAFGNVTDGMEVVDNFINIPRGIGRMGEISSPDTPIFIKYAGTIEADSAGNPRIQFLINIDADSTNTDSTAATETISAEITESTLPLESTECITDSSVSIEESNTESITETTNIEALG